MTEQSNVAETSGGETVGGKTVEVEKLQTRLRISWALNVALLLLVVVLAVAMITGGKQQVTANDVPEATAESVQPEAPSEESSPAPSEKPAKSEPGSHLRMQADDPMAIGDINAPVVMSEWFDYRCPFCSMFSNETLPALIAEYVDTGKLRIEFNDVYFFGDDSLSAAIAARAAAKQGYYLPYVETIAAAAPTSGHPDLPRETLIEFAKTAGVPDIDAFVADLDSPELAAAVEASHNQAVAWGINSVPFFVIGDQAIAGAQPIEVFEQLIDQNLDS